MGWLIKMKQNDQGRDTACPICRREERKKKEESREEERRKLERRKKSPNLCLEYTSKFGKLPSSRGWVSSTGSPFLKAWFGSGRCLWCPGFAASLSSPLSALLPSDSGILLSPSNVAPGDSASGARWNSQWKSAKSSPACRPCKSVTTTPAAERSHKLGVIPIVH